MGIQGFTTVFPPKREIKYKELAGKNITIDARAEIYRAASGMKFSKNLRDINGNPTDYINTILLGVILKLKGAGANQYWVFDYDQKRKIGESFHIPMKEEEIAKRNLKKQKARSKLGELKKQEEELRERASSTERSNNNSEAELFSSSEDEVNKDAVSCKNDADDLIACKNEIDKYEKRSRVIHKFYTDDVIMMLNLLDVPWLTCLPGFEAEQICSMATKDDRIFGVKMDYVLTPDADAILFGAEKVLKRDIHKKKIMEYNTSELLTEYKISSDEIIKIGLILGHEYAPKTPGIGIKTVLKKYDKVVLTEQQEKAMVIFKREITDEEIAAIDIMNKDRKPFTDMGKYTDLLDWLQFNKSFNRSRIETAFKKAKVFVK